MQQQLVTMSMTDHYKGVYMFKQFKNTLTEYFAPLKEGWVRLRDFISGLPRFSLPFDERYPNTSTAVALCIVLLLVLHILF